MIFTRQKLEELEKLRLAKYAVISAKSKGRKYTEVFNDERLCFQRDKDRIIHSRSFRRLDEKTQVFMAGMGDHYRTRLTHTLEVAQISRDLARRLGLNEDLCEAIALAHDLGHPPFGHGGEEALNEVMKEFGMSFEHNRQSKRIVEKLENLYPGFDGLNLTFEVLEGLMKHQTAWDQADRDFDGGTHLEAQIVNIADEIAYTNHDMDDGIRSGLINPGELEKFKVWQLSKKAVKNKYGDFDDEQVFISRMISNIISMMIDDLTHETEKRIIKNGISNFSDVLNLNGKIADFSENMKKMISELRKFLYENFYMNPKISEFIERGKTMIRELFYFYLKNPVAFDSEKYMKEGDTLETAVKDYIAGMTDGFLTSEYDNHIIK